ncbi:MAG: hypothetical protein AUK54_04285 [Helicobacteraceae bacterium CG2_30_36_10]|nr:MAG: hypothetical protein AUK54_04285 [Helicobacteraceae bacterium CG2_30_36_10]
MQYLVIVALIAIVYFFFIKKKPIQHNSKKEESSKPQSNDMVKCSACGIYCEINESILSNAKYYCSSECVEKK